MKDKADEEIIRRLKRLREEYLKLPDINKEKGGKGEEKVE